MNHVKFSVSAHGDGAARLEVDGVDIAPAVRSFTVEAGVGQLTEVTIRLAAAGTEVDGEARLYLRASQVGLLTRFGWKLPDDYQMSERGDVLLTAPAELVRGETP